MSLRVLDMPRKEFKRFLDRKTVVSSMRVDGSHDYVLVRAAVTFDDDLYNYWHRMQNYGNWSLTAMRQFDTLEDAQSFASSHRFQNEHVCLRNSGNCCIGFEIWHLVDDVSVDLDDAAHLADAASLYEGLVQLLAADSLDYNKAFVADFNRCMRIWFNVSFDGDKKTGLAAIFDDLLDLSMFYGISGVCSAVTSYEYGIYNVGIMLEYEGPASGDWWYDKIRVFDYICRCPYILLKVKRPYSWLDYAIDRYHGLPLCYTGVFNTPSFVKTIHGIWDESEGEV